MSRPPTLAPPSSASSLRQRVLAELSARDVRGLTVVPERSSSLPGVRQLEVVIVTDVAGHRFRVLESGAGDDAFLLDEDTSPHDVCPTWLRVEAAPQSLTRIVSSMLDVIGEQGVA